MSKFQRQDGTEVDAHDVGAWMAHNTIMGLWERDYSGADTAFPSEILEGKMVEFLEMAKDGCNEQVMEAIQGFCRHLGMFLWAGSQLSPSRPPPGSGTGCATPQEASVSGTVIPFRARAR